MFSIISVQIQGSLFQNSQSVMVICIKIEKKQKKQTENGLNSKIICTVTVTIA